MRALEILREAIRDLRTGTSRSILLCLALLAATVPVVVADALTVNTIVHDAREFQSSGASTWVGELAGGIDAAACDALSELPGVRDSGARRDAHSPVTLSLLPSSPVPAVEVSPGFLSVLGARVDGGGGMVVSDAVGDALGTRTGAMVAATGGPLRIAGTYTYPDDGRRPGLSWAAASVVPTEQRFDECWVTVWPPDPGIRTVLPLAAAADARLDADTSLSVTQLNTSFGEAFDGEELLRERVTIVAPVVAFVCGVILGAVAVRVRRLELSARLHDGLRPDHLRWLLGIETLLWALPSTVVSAAVGAATYADVGAPDAASLMINAVVIAVSAACGAVLGTLLMAWSVRETQLFVAFKER